MLLLIIIVQKLKESYMISAYSLNLSLSNDFTFPPSTKSI